MTTRTALALLHLRCDSKQRAIVSAVVAAGRPLSERNVVELTAGSGASCTSRTTGGRSGGSARTGVLA